MTFNRRNILAIAAVSPLVMAAADQPVTIFEAAKIVTMEPSQPSARFVAVSGGIILAVADRLEELKPWTVGRDVTVDRRFAHQILMPGFLDPHIHPMQSAVMLNLPFLAPDDWTLPSGHFPGVRTPEGYRKRLAELASEANVTPLIVWGYHELFHGVIDRAVLDSISPDRPLMIWQRSFHDMIVNSRALDLWGMGSQAAFDAALSLASADPQHANWVKGLFSETALPVALARLRAVILAPERITNGMAALQKMMLTSGVTTVSDMGTGIFAGFETEAKIIKAAFERRENPSRVMLMPIANEFNKEPDLEAWYAGMKSRLSSPHVRVDRRVKMLADGAFFAQNMRMNSPGYTDGHIGKWITMPDVVQAQFHRFWEAGFNLHIHVNGDEGLDVVLDGLEALAVRRSQTITLEHLGYSTEAQNRRIDRMGLMVSAQPNYIRVLGDAYAETGLGPDRAANMNRLGSLERKGVPLGLHSDFNMAPIDPLYLAWIATNRITIGGHVKGPEERLSLDKAMRAITIEAAQVIGMDALVGSIASGKKADFTVLDKDPYAVGAARLREIKVQGVIFEGRWVSAV